MKTQITTHKKIDLKSFKLLSLLLVIVFIQACADKEEKMTELESVQDHIELALKTNDIDPEMIRVVQSQSGDFTAVTLEEQIFSDDPKLDEDPESSEASILSHRERVLIVGDSWAFFQCLFNSMGKAIKDNNAPLKNDYRCLRSTIPGIEANEWIASKQHKRVLKYLKKNKNIKYMVLTLGGNDLMAQWHKNMTAREEVKLFEKIKSDLIATIQLYQQVNPDLKIIISGYDYPHFLENHRIPLFRRIYERMLRPAAAEMNAGLIRYSRYMSSLNLYNDKTFFVHHLGLSQYHHGVPEYQIPAQKTLPPHQISTMAKPDTYGGLIEYPTSQSSMINWFTVETDAFHLNSKSYRNIMNHVYQNRLAPLLN